MKQRAGQGNCFCFTCNRVAPHWQDEGCNGCIVYDWLESQSKGPWDLAVKRGEGIPEQRKKELLKLLRAYAYDYDGELIKERNMFILNSAENIANYIMADISVNEVIIRDFKDNPVVTTFGYFINKCPDQKFLLQELQQAIIPLQLGEKEPGPVKSLNMTPLENEWLEGFFLPF